MKSGGYKVIDLKNIPLSNFAVNYPGIYEQIEASNKLCVVSGLNAGSVEYDDVAVLFRGGSTFTAKIHDTLILSVKDTDDVTVIVTDEVTNQPSIDMSNYNIPTSGIVESQDLYRAILNVSLKGKQFYLSDLKLANLDSGFQTSHITVPLANNGGFYKLAYGLVAIEEVAYVLFVSFATANKVAFTLKKITLEV